MEHVRTERQGENSRNTVEKRREDDDLVCRWHGDSKKRKEWQSATCPVLWLRQENRRNADRNADRDPERQGQRHKDTERERKRHKNTESKRKGDPHEQERMS